MKKKLPLGAIISLILGIIFVLGGCFLLANRFMPEPLWSYNSAYLTDNFLFILFGALAAFIGILLLVYAFSSFKRNNVDNEKMKQHMGMKATSRISNTVIYVLLILISIVWLVPFI